jgi:hypothetical protein
MVVGLENGVIWCVKGCGGASVNCIIERELVYKKEIIEKGQKERKEKRNSEIRNQEGQKERKRPD